MHQHGLSFIDTAEVYGSGESERIIGDLYNRSNNDLKGKVIVASKFIPIPATHPPLHAIWHGAILPRKSSAPEHGQDDIIPDPRTDSFKLF